jgi:nucleotide-binding universal stress UspA family protein
MTGEIVVGVDRSVPSRAALRWSVERAESTRMSLRIIHVIDRPRESIDPVRAEESRAQSWELVTGEVAFAQSLDADLRVEGEVAEGDPLQELRIASRGADLVVVGTHKTGFIHGNVFGSRFLGLASGTGTASAFIPEPSGTARKGVVAGLDSSDIGREVIEFAADEATRTSQDLILISSNTAAPKWPSGVSVASEFSRLSYPDQLAWGVQIARKRNPQLQIRGRNASRPPAESLVRAATAAAVLIVGHAQDQDGAPVMIGTVALDVLLNISSPVIVLRGVPKSKDPWRGSEVVAASVL